MKNMSSKKNYCIREFMPEIKELDENEIKYLNNLFSEIDFPDRSAKDIQ